MKVLDFGVSKLVGCASSMTKTSTRSSAPLWPGAALVLAATPTCARTSGPLASVLYELLTGNVARARHTLPSSARRSRRCRHRRRAKRRHPPALEAVILRALAKEPADRCPARQTRPRARRRSRHICVGEAHRARSRRGSPGRVRRRAPPRSRGDRSTPQARSPSRRLRARRRARWTLWRDHRRSRDAGRARPRRGRVARPRWLLAGLAVVAIMGLVGGAVTLAGRARATARRSTPRRQTMPVRASAEEERTPLPPPTGAASVDPPAGDDARPRARRP